MTDHGRRLWRVQHISLPFPGSADSIEEARRFYGEILGLEERPRPPVLPAPGLWYGVGDQELHLFAEQSGVDGNAQTRRHPCFQVDAVDVLLAHLTAAGVPTRDHDGEIPGRPRFFAVDPFGNTLEFVTFEADHW